MLVAFHGSFIDLKKLPNLYLRENLPYPEIAIVGRSNVGKSSLINHLFRSKKIAKVSSTPGKTQLLNFFLIDNRFFLVDLPGYGFAKVDAKMKKKWETKLSQYLSERPQLGAVCVLLDLRHIPTAQDLQMLEWLIYHKKEIVLIFTKADKLSANQRASNKKKIKKILKEKIPHLKPVATIEYTIKEANPRLELMNCFKEFLQENYGVSI